MLRDSEEENVCLKVMTQLDLNVHKDRGEAEDAEDHLMEKKNKKS